jgi:hypothetical protein
MLISWRVREHIKESGVPPSGCNPPAKHVGTFLFLQINPRRFENALADFLLNKDGNTPNSIFFD